MTKIVVIEGADGTGKTTMAKYIAQDNGWRYVKMGAPTGPKNSWREEQTGRIMQALGMLKHEPKGIVFDRSWLGEWVYAPLFRDYEPRTELFEYVQEQLLEHDVLYILTRANWLWARRHMANDSKDGTYSNKNMILNPSNFNRVQDAFVEAFSKISVGRKFVFNQSNYPNQDVAMNWASLIVNRWRNGFQMYDRCDPMYALTCWNPRERFVNGTMQTNMACTCGHFKDHQLYDFWKKHHSITWGVGNVMNPEFIMIGEAPGKFGCGTTGIPFYFDKSGFFLRQLLYEHGVAETEYYITNISKCTPRNNIIIKEYASQCAARNLSIELNILPKDRPVIALGRTAFEWLKEYHPELDIRFIHHPAYALYKGTYNEYRSDFARLMESIGIVN